jgi:regulator of protease activity HflC (stomatin/prohibitin superfamily)
MQNIPLLVVVIILGLYLLSSIKILPEYERGVIFRLGRLLPEAKGPGIFLVFAPIDKIVRVSLRQEAFEVPSQDIITRDNVTLKVNAVVFLKVVEPRRTTAIRLRSSRRRRSARSSARWSWMTCSRTASSSTCAFSRSSTSTPSRGA